MDETRGEAAPLVIRGPAELISAIPYMLGYHPARSVVAVGTDGPHGACAIRLGLELPPGSAAHLAALLTAHGFTEAMLVCYGPAEHSDPVMNRTCVALAHAGIGIVDALRVDDGRYWSYMTRQAEGVPLRPTAVEVQAVVNGLVALPSREDLVASVAPLPDPVAAAVARETARAERRPLGLAEGLRLVREVMAGVDSGRPPPGIAEVARFTVALSQVRLRDEAWVRIEPKELHAQRAFWLHVLRRTAPPYRAAPACLLAYCAFLSGDGALANVALEVAEDAAPGYSLADLLRQTMEAGVHPSTASMRMTPEDLARAYADPPETWPG
ncbi:DUF4192 domain-containing protein [Actinocorallia sp. A-T 12471]|uniref:DUF4192 domain-containing protein n=1 Tax=Actinocorallia sp. A-T 12471 TaxID=3089813 RepID=UPI0029CDE21A|nr:DUF4192 domain-containing protein [Actinocorallia sp. A-T 12471]MDX6739924.1 DUF4192 domain-containing protein [Actinocorallia sp. A-T 12471]